MTSAVLDIVEKSLLRCRIAEHNAFPSIELTKPDLQVVAQAVKPALAML